MEFPINRYLIAPLWDDFTTTAHGRVIFALLTQHNQGSNISSINIIRSFLRNHLENTFSPMWAIVAQWVGVCPFSNVNCSEVPFYIVLINFVVVITKPFLMYRQIHFKLLWPLMASNPMLYSHTSVVLFHKSKIEERLVSQLGTACIKIIHFLEQQMWQILLVKTLLAHHGATLSTE